MLMQEMQKIKQYNVGMFRIQGLITPLIHLNLCLLSYYKTYQ